MYSMNKFVVGARIKSEDLATKDWILSLEKKDGEECYTVLIIWIWKKPIDVGECQVWV